MKTYHITLSSEELDSLDNLNEIAVFEDVERDIKICIRLLDDRENNLRSNILFRYNNAEYWNEDVLEYDCALEDNCDSYEVIVSED